MEVLDVEILSTPEKKPKIFDESEEDRGNGSSDSKESVITTESFESRGSAMSKGSSGSVESAMLSTEDGKLSDSKPYFIRGDIKNVIICLGEDYDYSTDEDDYIYSEEDADKYLQQIEKTEGYEVDYYKGIGQNGGIQPSPFPLRDSDIELFSKYVKSAVREYDGKHGSKLQFLKITNLCTELGGPNRAYITFEAKDGDDGDIKVYQTRVSIFPGRHVIEEVRLKPGVN